MSDTREEVTASVRPNELPSAVESSWFWLNKRDAAALLKVNPRQVERRVEAGQIKKQVIPRKPWQHANPVVFSRADIEAILRGEPNQYAVIVKKPKSVVAAEGESMQAVQAVEEKAVVHANGAPSLPVASVPWRDLLAGLASSAKEKPWLSLTEAAEYTGLPLRWLRDRARAGAVHAHNVGLKRERWMFNREALGKIP
jgi:hypothetical protein